MRLKIIKSVSISLVTKIILEYSLYRGSTIRVMIGHKPDSQKNKKVEFGTNCAAILFTIRNNPYTRIFGLVGVGIDDLRQKIQNFRLRENHSFGNFRKTFFQHHLK